MSELGRSLAELRRVGVHLDPAERTAASARRRERLNTVVYPRTRAIGFHLLLAGMVFHNVAVFGGLNWGAFLPYLLVVEAYIVGSWLALRRWFTVFPRVRGWDLADLLFVADLALWGAAIHVTGGPASVLWILPLLRVADHHPVRRVWVFAHLAPLTYAGVLAWTVATGGAIPSWGVEAAKLVALYGAGLYVALTSGPSQRYRAQVAAARDAATALLGDLTRRTRRLDDANRSRGQLLDRLGGDLRQTLVRISGFSGFLLRDEGRALGGSARGYVERVQQEARKGIRLLDEAVRPAGPAPNQPRVSLSGLLQKAAAEEAQASEEWRESARLVLPEGDGELEADGPALSRILRHLLAAARHFGGGPPDVELRLDPATATPESIVIRCAAGAGASAPGMGLSGRTSTGRAADPADITARLELDLAQSMSGGLGYRVDLSTDADHQLITLHLR